MVIGLKDNGQLNDFANDWLNSNFTVLMQYYIWNYTNAIEIVDRGMKPDAYQVGPYSYRYCDVLNYKSHLRECLKNITFLILYNGIIKQK